MPEQTQPQRLRDAFESLADDGVLANLPEHLRRYCAVPDCEDVPLEGSPYCEGHPAPPNGEAA